jgi:hypothetical protein
MHDRKFDYDFASYSDLPSKKLSMLSSAQQRHQQSRGIMLNSDGTDELALTTGEAEGIGRATAVQPAALGCNIAVLYHSAKAGALELLLLNELHRSNGKAMAF